MAAVTAAFAPPEPTGPITSLPPLPNPTLFRNAPNAPVPALPIDGFRALKQLAEGASSGSVDYPYPITQSYPLPPLPPVPVPPSGAGRRRRSPVAKSARPIILPAIPEDSVLAPRMPLPDLVANYNLENSDSYAALHFGASALLVRLANRGYIWALIRTLGDVNNCHNALALSVRFFPSRDVHPPPIHALPPPGPAQVLSDHLTSLSLSVPALLYRLPHILQLLDASCHYCGKHLNDTNGLPLSVTGFIPASKHGLLPSAEAQPVVRKRDSILAGPDGGAPAATADGRWVAWHASCEDAHR